MNLPSKKASRNCLHVSIRHTERRMHEKAQALLLNTTKNVAEISYKYPYHFNPAFEKKLKVL
ncbi:AraC-like DNA-binding protein [Siphonobacter sp. BAB-5404]|nr:AraC-like DNA-binding protein [Siphonobacter sp. SORGH_AS_0500]